MNDAGNVIALATLLITVISSYTYGVIRLVRIDRTVKDTHDKVSYLEAWITSEFGGRRKEGGRVTHEEGNVNRRHRELAGRVGHVEVFLQGEFPGKWSAVE